MILPLIQFLAAERLYYDIVTCSVYDSVADLNLSLCFRAPAQNSIVTFVWSRLEISALTIAINGLIFQTIDVFSGRLKFIVHAVA